jgi:hypothetical protein
MTLAKMLCDWTTVGGSGFTLLRQTAEKYVDALNCKDVTVFLEVAEVTNAPLMYIETSPMRDERLFTGIVGAFVPTVGVTVNVVRYETAAYPLSRYVRWIVVGNGTGYFSMTFRIWLALNESGNARLVAGSSRPGTRDCACKGECGSAGAATGGRPCKAADGSCGANHTSHAPAAEPMTSDARWRAFHARHAVHVEQFGAVPPPPGAPPLGGGSGHGAPQPCPTGTGINPAYTHCIDTHGNPSACNSVPEFVTFPACSYLYEANGPGLLGSLLETSANGPLCTCEYAGNCDFTVPNLDNGTMNTPHCANCPPQLYASECLAIAKQQTWACDVRCDVVGPEECNKGPVSGSGSGAMEGEACANAKLNAGNKVQSPCWVNCPGNCQCSRVNT